MINLLIKDFKLMFRQDRKLVSTILSAFLTVVFMAGFVTIEVYLFKAILGKIANVENAARTFLTLFLFVTTILLIVVNTFQAKKLFFDSKDIEQLSTHPVTNGQLIGSKLIFLFVFHCVTSLIFQYPLFVAYGLTMNRVAMFYYLSLFYPFASFFFVSGIALIFVCPAWLLSTFLKKHFILQFVLSICVIVALSVVYSYVLDLFINLVANNEMTSLLSDQAIEKFMAFEKMAVPVNFMVDLFVNRSVSALLPFIPISLGAFGIGLSISIYSFHMVRNFSVADNRSGKERKFKTQSIIKALIKKEFTLIAKNADYIYSFTGLLIVQPLLLQLVVKSINAVLCSGTFVYYSALVPGLITFIDMLVIMFFSVIINQGANSYITMESATIKVIKTIPVSCNKQLAIKVAIPYIFSLVSLTVSMIVLMATKTVGWGYGLFGWLLTAIFLFIFELISLQEELHVRRNKKRGTFLSSAFAYLFPLLFAGVAIILSFFGVNSYLSFFGGFIVCALLGVAPVVYVLRNTGKMFMDLEAAN